MSNSITGQLNGIGNWFNWIDFMSPDREEYAWYVGTVVRYAAYVEFGTYKDPEQPHLRPALEEARSNLDRIIGNIFETIGEDPEDIVRSIALQVEASTKRNAPVDTGNLQASYAAGPSIAQMEQKSGSRSSGGR